MTFGDFLEGVALPPYRSKWKTLDGGHHREQSPPSSAGGVRRQRYIRPDSETLQSFPSIKAVTFSRSVVAHLRWDLRADFQARDCGRLCPARPDREPSHPQRGEVVGNARDDSEERSKIDALDSAERGHRHLAPSLAFVRARFWLFSAGTLHKTASSFIEQRLYRGHIDASQDPVIQKDCWHSLTKQPRSCGNGCRW